MDMQNKNKLYIVHMNPVINLRILEDDPDIFGTITQLFLNCQRFYKREQFVLSVSLNLMNTVLLSSQN